MYIRTGRLLIRNFAYDDWRDVYDYTSDNHTMMFIPGGLLTEEKAKQFVRDNINDNAENFAVLLAKENKLIGHLVFHKYFGEHTYEIGWVFNSAFHNRGYASEAATALLSYGFEEKKLHRIIATCQPENTASYRVMEKIGMRREGYFRKCIPYGTEWWDEYYYAMLSEEWQVFN